MPSWAVAAPAITLEIAPTHVDLVPDGPATVLVIARNDSTAPARNLRLEGITDAPVSLGIDPPPELSLPPQSSLTWHAHITATQALATARPLTFALTYQWLAADQPTVTGVAVGMLDLRPASVDAVEHVATLRVEQVGGVVHERHDGTLLLVVENTTDVPLSILEARAEVPEFLNVTIPHTITNEVVTPRSQVIVRIPVEVGAGTPIQQGEHLLLFQVDLDWERDGRVQTGSLIATQTVAVGVPGGSDILQVLGVPSFFLLPGFLLVAGFVALWTYIWPRGTRLLEIKSPEYWLLAITLSLIAALVYPHITQRDYLAGYGLRDIFSVWTGGLVVALLAWIVSMAGSLLWRKGRRWWLMPSKRDPPLTILRKLARHHMEYPPERVHVTLDSQAGQAFCIAPADIDPDGQWVGPVIRLCWRKSATAEQRKQIKERLEQAEQTKDPASVCEVLMQLRSHADLKWDKTGPVECPTCVSGDAIASYCARWGMYIEEDFSSS